MNLDSCSKCPHRVLEMGWNWWKEWQKEIYELIRWCLITSRKCMIGQQWGHMCMILFVVIYWPLFCVRWKQKTLSLKAYFGHAWMNRWCELACLSLISMGLWLMLRVWITMWFIKSIVVTQMFPWKARNVHTFTIGKKAYESTQKNWYFLLFRKITLVFAGNGYNP